MMKLALKPDESLDPENSNSESACPPTEARFRAEGVAGGVIGRDEWFEEPSLVCPDLRTEFNPGGTCFSPINKCKDCRCMGRSEERFNFTGRC